RDNSGDIEGAMVLSPTRFEKYNLTIPQSLDELVPTLKALQEAQKQDTGIAAYVYEHSLTRCPVMFHRGFDSWPFYASQDGIFMVR
ncbi:MAG: hypothetical protein SCM11_16235, partial [Bacillota bacterium]|nr:hypothetical protein [Bacillota bacterium]